MSGLYSIRQLRQLEHMVLQQGVTKLDLVKRAAAAAYDILAEKWPHAERVDIFVGKGGNAADGLVLAQLLHEAGRAVHVTQLFPVDQLTEVAREAFELVKAALVPCDMLDESDHSVPNLYVDAMLGVGISKALEEPVLSAVALLNAANVPVLALDVPTGLNADTGSIEGAVVQAHTTVTFIAPKKGMSTGKAVACVGELVLADLDLPAESLRSMSPAVEVLDSASLHDKLSVRCRSAHKGDFGHVLVIGGDYGMGGAIRLAAESALRVGAGLVTVATRPEHMNIVSGGRPELMCHQVQQPSDLDRMLSRVSVIVLGPGLGQSEWAEGIFKRILDAPQPKVMDADALNLLSRAPEKSDQWVLTPHLGEASRLLDVSCADIQNNRFKAVKAMQERYGGVAVLKGAGTLICSAEQDLTICPAGNPGMASGGMGDILSGVIGGLLAQKCSLIDAANAGVWAHAQAADNAVKAGGGERGLLATDLLPHLHALVNA